MRWVIAGTALAVGTMASGGTALAAPDPARCPPLKPLEEPLNDRTSPLPIPQAFAALIGSSRDSFAIATVDGGTACVDTREMTDVEGVALSADRRFLSFDWHGYETGGHVVVDRSGRGQVIETGAEPSFSPSRGRFAAVQQSEAAFGALEGFGVWQAGAVGVRELTLLQDIPSRADWRIDGWAGEDCVNLSGLPLTAESGKARRERYVAVPGAKGWALRPQPGGCPAPKR